MIQSVTDLHQQTQRSVRSKHKLSRFKPRENYLFQQRAQFLYIDPFCIDEDQDQFQDVLFSEITSEEKFLSFRQNSSLSKDIKIKWSEFVKFKQKNYLNQYLIVKSVIGRGAYGIVQKVKSIQTGQLRAAKIIKKNDFDQLQLQILHEQLKIMKAIDHPHIIKLYEVYDYETSIVLIMELCSGGELYSQTKGKRLQQIKVKDIIKQMLKALFYLHSRGIMHRDIKPQNMLYQDQSKLCIKLIDFGISAKFMQGQYFYQKCGTPSYMSPQVLREQYNEKADIWAVGVSMYFLLSGKTSFGGQTQSQLYHNIIKQQIKFQGHTWTKISQKCKNIVEAMLCRNITNRPSAKQLLQNEYFQQNKLLSTQKSKQFSEPKKTQIVKQLRVFNYQNKLQAIIQTFIAAQILTQQEKQILIELFEEFDSNSDGVISTLQLKQALQKNKKISPERIQTLMMAIDTNGSGQIDYTQFLAAGFNDSKHFKKERLSKVFRYFDNDGNGKISYLQVIEFLSNYDESEAETIKAYEQFDTNGDGSISEEEFIELLLQKTSSINQQDIKKNSQKQVFQKRKVIKR